MSASLISKTYASLILVLPRPVLRLHGVHGRSHRAAIILCVRCQFDVDPGLVTPFTKMNIKNLHFGFEDCNWRKRYLTSPSSNGTPSTENNTGIIHTPDLDAQHAYLQVPAIKPICKIS